MSNKLLEIEINKQNKKNTILLNVIKMLSERKLIDKSRIDNLHDKLKKTVSDEQEYFIDEKIGIKFIEQKMTTINKVLVLTDFLNKYKDIHKIVIVSNINKKVYKQILEYDNTEVFWDYELMLNLIDHVLIPKHEILTDDEIKTFYDDYIVKKKQMPKIEQTDPVSRYYNLRPGQIVRIIRPSITSGLSVSYRLVVHTSMNQIFD